MSRYNELKKKVLNSANCCKASYNDNVINVNINSSAEVLSPYTEDNCPVINTEFAHFLNNSVKNIPINQDVVINISSKHDNMEQISSAIKSYYYNEFMDSQRKLKFNLIFSLITLTIGLIAFAISLAQHILAYPILAGAIDIFAWVFMWEAFDLFFFRRAEIRHQQYRQINFINATITHQASIDKH